MELSSWIKVLDRLLPRSRLFSLSMPRTLTKFLEGLAAGPQVVREHLASVLLEAFPATTTHLSDWSEQFGSAEELSVSELVAKWAATGGQDPDYFMGVLYAAGFTTLYMHEWWDPTSTDTPILRDPSPQWLVDNAGGRLLVNDLGAITKNYIHQFKFVDRVGAKQFVADGSVSFGQYDGYKWLRKIYPHRDLEYEAPYYFVLCSETYGTPAAIDWDRLRYLEDLIFELKPCHLRVVLHVVPRLDGDIQDVYEDVNDDWQDVIAPGDDIQDSIEV